MVDLSLIRDAGAMIGPSNTAWWQQLVTTYGANAVEAVVAALKDETRQPVNVAHADRQLKADHQAAAAAAADEAEDLAQASTPTGAARTSPVVERYRPTAPPPVSTATQPTPAAAEVSSPTTAAGPNVTFGFATDHRTDLLLTMQANQPARSTTTEPPKAHAMKNPALIKQLTAKRDLSGMTNRDLAAEIGMHEVTVSKALRTGEIGPRLLPKLQAWLEGTLFDSLKSDQVDTKADTVALQRLEKNLAGPGSLNGVQVSARVIKLDPKTAAQHARPLATSDTYLDQMDALGVAINALARQHPRETAVLARLYASIADQLAELDA